MTTTVDYDLYILVKSSFAGLDGAVINIEFWKYCSSKAVWSFNVPELQMLSSDMSFEIIIVFLEPPASESSSSASI